MLEKITRAELEKERIFPRPKSHVEYPEPKNVLCDVNYRCSEKGNFMRCYLSIYRMCPRFVLDFDLNERLGEF